MPDSTPVSLATARLVVDAAQVVLDESLSALKQACSEGGRLKSALLDQHQWVSFDLARSAAEISATRHILDYAASVRGTSDASAPLLEERIAAAYCAEMYSNLRSRMAPRLADFKIDARQFQATLDKPELLDWAAQQNSVENIVALGDSVRDSNGHLGGSLLDQEHQFMADNLNA